ncbi:A/G-specific adenine glycosylase [Magnetovirga frankeli]|uniref:A/G-specific adenine glycosylase n=1 Tax=Magnetovirga frankeli TaxID=947516 RepID=UPI00129416A8|nr:A/G-specific adenine glycosylase [gamma proteobacterium SS-5]
MIQSGFAPRLLAWYARHGRRDLPWQQDPTPYRVWVSEIMLQQTQVRTVIPYFRRFCQRFADLPDLAQADQDEVLHLWTGLGYYARARNLHQAAGRVLAEHGGRVPQQLEPLMALPGIGRSTAGAILSLALGQCQPILDGNVKRVLARCFAIAGHPSQAAVQRQLWQLAEQLLPEQGCGPYNQALMDLGASLCSRSKPDCAPCPLSGICSARLQGRTAEFPGRRPSKALPQRACRLLILRDEQDRVLLHRRPPSGIWGGLWSLPECPLDEDIAVWAGRRFGVKLESVEQLAVVEHSFSHFQLQMHPCQTRITGGTLAVMETELIWYNLGQPEKIGLAAPVARLLARLQAQLQTSG